MQFSEPDRVGRQLICAELSRSRELGWKLKDAPLFFNLCCAGRKVSSICRSDRPFNAAGRVKRWNGERAFKLRVALERNTESAIAIRFIIGLGTAIERHHRRGKGIVEGYGPYTRH